MKEATLKYCGRKIMIPLESYRELYLHAASFAAMAPWEWLYDSDVIILPDESAGITYYGCVLGNMGTCFGIALYRGDSGLTVLSRLLRYDDGVLPPDTLEQDAFLLTFESRKRLEKIDLDILKNLKFNLARGARAPSVRNMTPGFAPWPLTDSEAKFFTHALIETMNFAQSQGDYTEGSEENYLRTDAFRAFKRDTSDPSLTWKPTWIPFPSDAAVPKDIYAGNPFKLKSLKEISVNQDATWEADVIYFPSPINEGDRPYHPRMIVIVDAESGFIFSTKLMSPEENLGPVFEDSLVEISHKVGFKPATIRFQRNHVSQTVEPLLQSLNIVPILDSDLPNLNEAHEEMRARFLG